jgi:hypothetical protein
MQLLEELLWFDIKMSFVTPIVRCKVFEMNLGAIELAKAPKLLRLRTKHIAIQYHNFHSGVAKKLISIQHLTTTEQVVNIAPKPLPRDQFKYLRQQLLGWSEESLFAREWWVAYRRYLAILIRDLLVGLDFLGLFSRGRTWLLRTMF